MIRDDWESVAEKVRDGRAHRLSEGDTEYLAATVKGQKATDRRIQPYSDERAKPRAFSLKSSYMSTVWDESQLRASEAVASVADLRAGRTLEQIVSDHFRPYIGMTASAIAERLGLQLNATAKNYFAVLTKRVLGYPRIEQSQSFRRAASRSRPFGCCRTAGRRKISRSRPLTTSTCLPKTGRIRTFVID